MKNLKVKVGQMMKLKATKVCVIENAQFSYMLRVDGEGISFQGSRNADYFEKHYKCLGYEVIRTKTCT